MRRYSILVFVIFVLFIPVSGAGASNYEIDYVDIITRLFEDGTTTTNFWFSIRDTENWNTTPLESVVRSVTIKYPDDTERTLEFDYYNDWRGELRGTDNNSNGMIDINLDEYEQPLACGQSMKSYLLPLPIWKELILLKQPARTIR